MAASVSYSSLSGQINMFMAIVGKTETIDTSFGWEQGWRMMRVSIKQIHRERHLTYFRLHQQMPSGGFLIFMSWHRHGWPRLPLPSKFDLILEENTHNYISLIQSCHCRIDTKSWREAVLYLCCCRSLLHVYLNHKCV